jgi:putative DNA-invertase from lambdoid prophage Rac
MVPYARRHARAHVCGAGVSGSVPLRDRPEGAQLLAIARKGDTIVAPKLDRVFRSALDALQVIEDLQKRGIGLVLLDLGGDVSGNGISRLVLTILAAVAEEERDRIRERITGVKRDQHARGRYLGGKPPFGYSVGADGALQAVPEQQEAIARARTMRHEGVSFRAIRAALAEEGHALSLDALHRLAGPAHS